MFNSELIAFLFDGKSSHFSVCMAEWLASSRRYTSFVDGFRDKIRKKIRVTESPESLLDLQLELETAFLLLKEKPLSVMYEPDHAKRINRTPDFAVTYTTSLTFMLEVTRMQTPKSKPLVSLENPSTLLTMGVRLTDTICSKLGQLQPKQANVLLIGLDPLALTENDLRAAMLYLQGRAERGDTDFIHRYGFRDRADFLGHYQRLSEVLVRGPVGTKPLVWINAQAKHALPSKVRTVLYRSQTT